MEIENALTDGAVLLEIGKRVRSLRLEGNISQADLAQRAGLSSKTVMRLEKGEDVQLSALIKCLRALNVLEALDLALPEPRPRPSSYLHGVRQRKRASKKTDATAQNRAPGFPAGDWKWGDEQ